uniref:VWFC domain-containing protein n=1 Tax=Ciona savignyi TaxID=51511 RepID=H2Z3U8_CIOSA
MFLAGSEIISRVPKKNGCFSESRFRQNGEVFPMGVSNMYQATCSMCACVDGNVYCRTKTCGPFRCPRPVSSSNDCCLVCPTEDTATVSVSRPTVSTRLSCKSGETVHESGAVWKPNVPSMSNACVQCSCENGDIRCRIPKCPEVKCAYPILPEDRCCRVCPTTTSPPRTTSTPPPSACEGELQLSQFIPIPGTPQEHQIDFSFRLNKTYNSTVPSLPVGIVISVKLPRTFLVYDWMIDSGDKRRQVLNVRPSVFQKYSATRNHLGSFQTIGYITKKRLENFRRKESRWSKHCRKRCSDRLKRILNAMASKRALCKV